MTTLAMPFYALATIPLIRELSNQSSVKQVWYADDSSATGKFLDIRKWWDSLTVRGPSYGYYANNSKTWLIVKPSVEASAKEIFKNTGINITTEGRPYLGSPLSQLSYIKEFVNQKITTGQSSILTLTDIASSQPHAAFAAFTHSLSSHWLFLCRTTLTVVLF